MTRGPIGPSSRPRFYLVGEAYGEHEERRGEPFVGPAGMVLDSALAQAGISKATCRINNVFNFRPPKNDITYFYEDKKLSVVKDEFQHMPKALIDDIRTTHPECIVLMGNTPLREVLGMKDITKRRGSVFYFEGIPCIPTIHPSHVLRGIGTDATKNKEKGKSTPWLPIVIHDLKRAAEAAKPEFRLPELKLFTLPTYAEVNRFIDDVVTSDTLVAFDIECIGDMVSCIGISHRPFEAMCIPFLFNGGHFWPLNQRVEIWKRIDEVMNSKRVKLVLHNAGFDLPYLAKNYNLYASNLYMDTMLAAHAAYIEYPKSLAFLTSMFTLIPYYKDDGKYWTLNIDYKMLYEYNCKDAITTRLIAEILQKEMDVIGVRDIYNHMMGLYEPTIEMAQGGLAIDIQLFMDTAEKLRADIAEKQQRLDEKLGYHLNTGSPIQMRKLLYEDMGFEPQYKRGAGTLTADKVALLNILAKSGNDTIKLILKINEAKALVQKFFSYNDNGTPKLVENDGKFRCSINISGTGTGRLSSSRTIYGTGANMQNIPRAVRGCFIAEPGYILLYADMSQAEARGTAWMAEDEGLMRIFSAGGDVYIKGANMIFKLPEDAVDADTRQLAKKLILGANYGLGYKRLAKLAQITNKEAELALELYHNAFPGIRLWHNRVRNIVARQGYLQTIFGRKRYFYSLGQSIYRFSSRGEIDQKWEAAYAFEPQSTIGDALNIASKKFVICRRSLNKHDWRLKMNVHDALLLEVPVADAKHAAEVVTECMNIPLYINNRMLHIPVKVEAGYTWEMGEDLDHLEEPDEEEY